MTTSRPPARVEVDPDARDPRRLIVFGVAVAALALLLAWVLYTVRTMVVTVYISALFAMGISPLVRMIEQQTLVPAITRLPRWLAILAIYATILGALVLVGIIVVPPLGHQAEELWQNLPERITETQRLLVRIGILRAPLTLDDAVQQGGASSGGVGALNVIFSTLRNVAGGVFGLITILLLTFYMLVEAGEIRAFFARLFPARHRDRVATISATVTRRVSAWLGGQLLLSLIIGLTSAVGLWVMGVPYFYVLALISAVGELIPMVGPILAAIPAIVVAASVSPGLAIGVAVFFIVQQQLENTILVPKVMGRQVGLSAVTVIIALGIGSQLLGIVGAILSVPTAAIAHVLFQELVGHDGDE